MGSRQYLVADADAGQRQLLDLLLSDGESIVVGVETAKQALEFLKSNTPALAVLAYELPDMPGTEVGKRLKLVARLQAVPVIVTVDPGDAFGVSEDVRSAAADAGVELLVPKPLGDKALRERATRLIQAAQSRDTRAPARIRHDTGVIEESLRELEARQHPPAADLPPQSSALKDGEPELERLRQENAKLRRRVLAQQEAMEKLRAEFDEARRASRRGLFGRRRED